MRKKIVIAALGSFLVSGCSTYSLEKLRHTTPKGNEFQTALAKLYMNFSDSEEKDYDWQDSWYFADKGLLAAYGRETSPEELDGWNLPAGKLAHLEKGREDLMAILTPEIMAKKPEVAARAQVYFDCWVEQQEENWQKDDIEACRDSFVRALAELDVPDHKKAKKIIKKKKYAKKIEDKFSPATTSFMVVFTKDTVNLTAAAESTMSEIINNLAKEADKGYEVVIIDKSAGKKDHLELSLERVQAVKNKLLGAGINESAIKTDGSMSKQSKRRIEILLND